MDIWTAIISGLLGGCFWGGANLLLAICSLKRGLFSVLLLAQGSGVLLLALAGLWSPTRGLGIDVLLVSLEMGLLLGCCAAVGTLATGYSLMRGPLLLVSPLIASSSGVTLLLAALFLHEVLSFEQLFLLGVVITGVVFLSIPPPEHPSKPHSPNPFKKFPAGLLSAGLAALAIGLATFGLGVVALEETSRFPTLFFLRLSSCGFLLVGTVLFSTSVPSPPKSPVKPTLPALVALGSWLGTGGALLAGGLDTAGTILYSLGASTSTSLTMASSAAMMTVIPFLYGWLIRREHIGRWQWLGIVLIGPSIPALLLGRPDVTSGLLLFQGLFVLALITLSFSPQLLSRRTAPILPVSKSATPLSPNHASFSMGDPLSLFASSSLSAAPMDSRGQQTDIPVSRPAPEKRSLSQTPSIPSPLVTTRQLSNSSKEGNTLSSQTHSPSISFNQISSPHSTHALRPAQHPGVLDLPSSPPPSDSIGSSDKSEWLRVGIATHPGIIRQYDPNEDRLLAIQGIRQQESGESNLISLFAVADGMGGHTDGEQASDLALRVISDVLVPQLFRSPSPMPRGSQHLIQVLTEGIAQANLAIYQKNLQRQQMMGTTITAALVTHHTAYIANVGDSRTYLYRKTDGLIQLTQDHSTVARLVEAGTISRDDIYTHPKRNQIYRCLGEQRTVEIDTHVVPLQGGDLLLLCSDGLWKMVRDPLLAHLIQTSPHPKELSSRLLQAALGEGGADNICLIVAEIPH